MHDAYKDNANVRAIKKLNENQMCNLWANECIGLEKDKIQFIKLAHSRLDHTTFNLLKVPNDSNTNCERIASECNKNDGRNGLINRINQMNDFTILHPTNAPKFVCCTLKNKNHSRNYFNISDEFEYDLNILPQF